MTFVLTLVIGGGATHAAAGITGAALYYDDADKNKLKSIFNDGEKQEDIGDMMKVVLKGGVFGDGTIFSFTSAVNQQLNQNGAGNDNTFNPEGFLGGDDSDEYFAVTPVYCSGNEIKLTEPETKPYFRINYVLGYHFGDWNDLQNKDNYETHAGITEITKVGDAGQADTLLHKKNVKTDFGNLSDSDSNRGEGENINSILPAGCNNALPRGSFDTKTRNFYKMSEAEKEAIKAIIEDAGGTGAGGAAGAVDSCQGGALGWVLCPIIDGFASAIQGAGSIIESLLTFRVLADKDDGGKIQAIHGAFVSMANILLIIVFMVIVFSQSTSVGLSNYGIKRMLPRLVMGAIFINLSFYICAFLIDISNIAGTSIVGFMIGAGGGPMSISGAINETVGGGSSGGVNFFSTGGDVAVGAVGVGAVGAGIAVASTLTATALLWLVVPILLAVLVSIFATMLVLIARQVILLGLVLVSPLAFAAWLLPNTDQYFKKWWSLFTQQLIIFPMLMAIFGASILAASLI